MLILNSGKMVHGMNWIANLNYLKGLLECYKGNDATGKEYFRKLYDYESGI